LEYKAAICYGGLVPYHVRLSAGPLNLRIKELFNLDRETLVSKIVEPWTQGRPILLDGRQWLPDATKISVYEGAALTSQQRSMWQGWTKAMEFGENVTNEVLTDEFRGQTSPSAELITPTTVAMPAPAGSHASPDAPAPADTIYKAVVSWAHGDESWATTILALASKLRELGIDVDVDLFHLHDPDVNWTTYGPKAIEDNDFVLVAVSAAYKDRWEGRNEPSTGAGAVREANVLKSLFNDDQGAFYRKVKIVVLPGATKDDIPAELKAALPRYEIATIDESGLEDLLRTITGQPAYPRPPLGEVPTLRARSTGVDQGAAFEPPLTQERIRKGLDAYVKVATEMLTASELPTPAEVQSWAGGAGVTVRAWCGEAWEGRFYVAGNGLDAPAELEAKVRFIHDDLMPKVIEGWFTSA
jgi:SEFIR domain